MIFEEIKQIKEDKQSLRKFGYTVGIAFSLFGIILAILGKANSPYLLIIGIILILSALISPELLKPLNKIWMMFAVVMGFVMTRVILTILFYFAVTPIGFLSKLSGKDFLDLKKKKKTESYWIKREKKENNPADYDRQF